MMLHHCLLRGTSAIIVLLLCILPHTVAFRKAVNLHDVAGTSKKSASDSSPLEARERPHRLLQDSVQTHQAAPRPYDKMQGLLETAGAAGTTIHEGPVTTKSGRPVQRWEMTLSHISWFIVLTYALLSTLVFFGSFMCPRQDWIYIYKLREASRLQASYESATSTLKADVKLMADLEIDSVKCSFEHLRQEFRAFFHWLHGADLSEECLGPLCTFISVWVRAYSDSNPGAPAILSEAELHKFTVVSTLCEFVATRLNKERQSFIEIGAVKHWLDEDNRILPPSPWCSWLQIFGLNKGFFYVEDPDKNGWPWSYQGVACGITLYSRRHMWLLASYILGIAILDIVCLCGNRVRTLIALGATLQMTVVLVCFEYLDPLPSCEQEVRALRKKRHTTEKYSRSVKEIVKNAQEHMGLWMHRTIPYLGIMKAMQLKIREYPDQGLELLRIAKIGLIGLDHNLGPKETWYRISSKGADSSSQDDLCGKRHSGDYKSEMFKAIRRKINGAEEFISSRDLSDTFCFSDSLFDLFSIVSLRIVAAHNLTPRKSLGTAVSPHARIRMGNGEWKRAATKQSEPNPSWSSHNEFHCIPTIEDTMIDIQIVEECRLRGDRTVGTVHVSFRAMACGRWNDLKLPLQGAEQGVVEISVHRTSDLQTYLASKARRGQNEEDVTETRLT